MRALLILLLLNTLVPQAQCQDVDVFNLLERGDLQEFKSYVTDNQVDLSHYQIGKFGLLFYAATIDVSPDIIDYLIKSGCDVNEQVENTGITPLMVAARHGSHIQVLKALLSSGADLGRKDMHGKTALLLSVASDYMIAPVEQWDFMLFAGQSERPAALTISVLETLLSAGADINASDNNMQSILHLAAKDATYEVMAFLVGKSAPVTARDKIGATPLFYAAESNTVKVIHLLLSAGVMAAARDKFGRTALFSAAADSPFPEVVEALVSAGLDLNLRGLAGATAAAWGFARNEHLAVLDRILALKPDLMLVDDGGNDVLFYASLNSKLKNTETFWRLNDAYWAQKQHSK